MSRCLVRSLILLAPALLAAQETRFTAPFSGTVFDRTSGSLRAIWGTPGAAYLGARSLEGSDAAWTSPDGASALVLRQGRAVVALGLDGQSPSRLLPVEGLLDGVDLAAWSQDGLALAVAVSGNLSIQRIDLRDGQAIVGAVQQLDGGGGRLSGMALTSSRAEIFAAVTSGSRPGVYWLTPDAPAQRSTAVEDPAFLSLLRDQQSLSVVNRASAQLLRLEDARGSARVIPLLELGDDAADLAGVAISQDGRSVFTASRTAKKARRYDLASQALTAEIELDRVPDTLDALPGGRHFLLNQRSRKGDALWVLAAVPELAAYFVPAGDQE